MWRGVISTICTQVDDLRGKHQDAEKRAAALKAEAARTKEEIKLQDSELKSLRRTVAQQVDEMVCTDCSAHH